MAYQTHPIVICAVQNHNYVTTKLAWHRLARYKIEWIYTQTKVSGQGSVELALEMKKKERQMHFFTEKK
jgi:hypothetical protein